MDVFITWSGEPSLTVATALHIFLRRTIQALKPFLSSADIRAGARWNDEIGQRLESARYAVVCLTKQNLTSSWIHFEAGAVSRKEKGSVTCLLIDVESTDVPYPLAQFQNTRPTKADVFKMMETVNGLTGANLVSPEILKDAFDQNWPALETTLDRAKQEAAKPAGHANAGPSTSELLQQLIAEGRANSSSLASIAQHISALESKVSRLRPRLNAGLRHTPSGNNMTITPGVGELIVGEFSPKLQSAHLVPPESLAGTILNVGNPNSLWPKKPQT